MIVIALDLVALWVGRTVLVLNAILGTLVVFWFLVDLILRHTKSLPVLAAFVLQRKRRLEARREVEQLEEERRAPFKAPWDDESGPP